ncbi:hypothetical protein L917_10542 [Phytophthora nicotianae]|uniref:Uncharacterized protein n=1 Tax=Phytophthora nicotianae TaxID=4792 RepID=W2L2K7_PHYNI|nr:hypothetical protein L917_10542 [Phytophthora nicotianae]
MYDEDAKGKRFFPILVKSTSYKYFNTLSTALVQRWRVQGEQSYDKAQDHSLYRVLVNKRVNFTKNGSIAGGPDKCGCDVSQQIQLRVQGSVKMQFTPDQEDVYDDIWHNIQLKQLEAPAETHGSCYTGCVTSGQLEADPIKWTISFSDGQTHDVILDELIADLTMATSRHI